MFSVGDSVLCNYMGTDQLKYRARVKKAEAYDILLPVYRRMLIELHHRQNEIDELRILVDKYHKGGFSMLK